MKRSNKDQQQDLILINNGILTKIFDDVSKNFVFSFQCKNWICILSNGNICLKGEHLLKVMFFFISNQVAKGLTLKMV